MQRDELLQAGLAAASFSMIGRSDFSFQFNQLFVERMEQVAARNREFVPVVFQQCTQTTAQLSNMLRKNNPVLCQQPANLTD